MRVLKHTTHVGFITHLFCRSFVCSPYDGHLDFHLQCIAHTCSGLGCPPQIISLAQPFSPQIWRLRTLSAVAACICHSQNPTRSGKGFRVHHLCAGTCKPIYRPAGVNKLWTKTRSDFFSPQTAVIRIWQIIDQQHEWFINPQTFAPYNRRPHCSSLAVALPLLVLPLPRQIQTSLAVSAATRRETHLLLNSHPESWTHDLFRKTVSSVQFLPFATAARLLHEEWIWNYCPVRPI